MNRKLLILVLLFLFTVAVVADPNFPSEGGGSVADSTCPAGQAPRSFTSGAFAGCFNAADQTASQVPLTDTDGHFSTDTVEFAIDQLADNTCTVIVGPESGAISISSATATAGVYLDMHTVSIPGGTLDAHSSLRVTSKWSTNGVNVVATTPVVDVEVNGSQIARQGVGGSTGNDRLSWMWSECWTENSTTEITCPDPSHNKTTNDDNRPDVYETYSFDVTASNDVIFRGDIANSGNQIALHHYKIEICR